MHIIYTFCQIKTTVHYGAFFTQIFTVVYCGLMNNLFSQRLKELIKIEGITQKDLATKIGVSQSCVTFWIKGERQPIAENIYTIAKHFNVTSDYLLGIDEI